MHTQHEAAGSPAQPLEPIDHEASGAGPAQGETARRSQLLHDLELHVFPVDVRTLPPNAARTGAITDIRLSNEEPDRTRVSMVAYETLADGHIAAWGSIQNAMALPEEERSYAFQAVGLRCRGVEFLAYMNYVIPDDEDSARITMTVTQRQKTPDFSALGELSKNLGEAMVSEIAGLLRGNYPQRKIDLMFTMQGPLESGYSQLGTGVCAMEEIVAAGSTTIDAEKFDTFWASSIEAND
ncbi:MAG TPA: hypothetical protein VLI54_03180 [Bacillota bacterium]|nr:hypothetical protein [Bacillota bacterium]